MWSSQAGSLLLWAWVLSIASSAVLFLTRRRHRELVPWATAVLAGLAAFFTGLMLFGLVSPGAESYPFARLDPAPAQGVGLNPLLRHPAMAIHPPMLYSGYVLFSIPFAFAIGALVARRLDASWIRSTRRFALVAWTFLTIGVLLGARWSYSELGWGGYWGWDAVENASLMPWLIGTAFLHSVMVQERRGMLKVWNVSLVVATFSLCLLGTFLVRSGVIESIHAFGVSKVGGPLLGLIAVVVLGSVALIVSRLDDLRSERRIDSLLSREAIFLVNNLLLVGLCVVIFWGTFFPLISEAFTGDEVLGRRAVLQPLRPAARDPARAFHRDRPARRLAPGLVAGRVADIPLACARRGGRDAAADRASATRARTRCRWRCSASRRSRSRRSSRSSPAGSRFAARSRAARSPPPSPRSWPATGAATAATSSMPGSRSRSSRSPPRRPSRRRATCASRPARARRSATTTSRYVEPTQQIDSAEQRLSFGAVLAVTRDGEPVTTLRPSRNYYSGMSDPSLGPISGFFEGETTSEVGRRDGLGGDIWSAMQPDLAAWKARSSAPTAAFSRSPATSRPNDPRSAAFAAQAQGLAVRALAKSYVSDPPPANFRVNVNPLVVWIWIGGAIGIGGALIALWPSPRRAAPPRLGRAGRAPGARHGPRLGRAPGIAGGAS